MNPRDTIGYVVHRPYVICSPREACVPRHAANAVRSGPTETKATGTPHTFAKRSRYARALLGKFLTWRTSRTLSDQPGWYSISVCSPGSPIASIPAGEPSACRYPVTIPTRSKPLRTSNLVTMSRSSPLTRAAYRAVTASNQPQRRGRPVTTPHSRPASRSAAASASGSSEGNGPPPPRVQYAFTTPVTERTAPGPIPKPMHAPPAIVDELVTYGYDP